MSITHLKCDGNNGSIKFRSRQPNLIDFPSNAPPGYKINFESKTRIYENLMKHFLIKEKFYLEDNDKNKRP